MISKRAALTALAVIAASAPARADVVISSDPTSNMNCSGGVCAPTATDAVLNVTDLENLLASGNVEVTTTGSGVQANNIEVKAENHWSNTSTLSLDAYQSVTISRPISVDGTAGLTLQTNDGGSSGALSFVRKGHAVFQHLSSQLTINGVLYTLESTLPSLASAINNNPSGNYALANDYDASADGTYTTSPISMLSGKFDGVGNKVSKLSIDASGTDPVGLFGTAAGRVADITVNATVSGVAEYVGALAGINEGTIEDSFASGSVQGGDVEGALVGRNSGGEITSSGASADTNGRTAGGLVGWNDGIIEDSFATGSVTGSGSATRPTLAGGLVGFNLGGIIGGCFATGSVSGGQYSVVGGLVGWNHSSVGDSYSMGSVRGKKAGSFAGFGAHGASFATSYGAGYLAKGKGGFIGAVKPVDSIENAYWDTDTSGITNLSQGAGNIPNFPGITGLTTEQLQSGLPAGFDPSVWAESPNINGGLPYLIANPPHRSIR